jgi:hypothetical protein
MPEETTYRRPVRHQPYNTLDAAAEDRPGAGRGGAPLPTFPSVWNAPLAACTLGGDTLRQSTERRPASIARIVHRRAATQNAWRCPVEQNRCAEPPVFRGVNGRRHQRQ